VPAYFFADWARLGLEPPPPGTQWVRYGPDLLLVDVSNGQVIDVAYGVFF
jgi:Ni/Co efflux regulator RcnB